MTRRKYTSASIRRLTISLLLLWLAASGAQAQVKFFSIQKDSIPMFRGFAVSFDMLGALQMAISDYGQYEGALRVNLHDEWFPIVEAGLGRASHEHDEVTGITYKTSAPYFKVGIDKNLLKKKHGPYRLYGGLRYGFTSYKVDLMRENYPDPVWLWDTGFGVESEKCSFHWMEAAVGVDAKIAGPVHLGWSVRIKRKLKADNGRIGRTWYVPGFGKYDDTLLWGTFNVIIDI